MGKYDGGGALPFLIDCGFKSLRLPPQGIFPLSDTGSLSTIFEIEYLMFQASGLIPKELPPRLSYVQ